MTKLSESLVMVVDDAQANVDLLVDVLDDEYRISVAMGGRDAVAFAKGDHPDLILLDVMMPDLDGFEVCRRLQADPRTRDILVIFVTAKGEELDEAEGLRLGAVDYIVKPISPAIVKARVRNHLSLSHARADLQRENRLLEEKVAERTAALTEANERLSVLDKIKSDFFNMIDHELRTPLHGVLGASEFLIQMSPPFEDKDEFVGFFRQGRARIEQLLDDGKLLQMLSAEEALSPELAVAFPLDRLMAEVAAKFEHLELDAESQAVLASTCVRGDRELLRRAMEVIAQLVSCFVKTAGPQVMAFDRQPAHIAFVCPLDDLHLGEDEARAFFDIAADIRSRSKAQQLGLSPVLAARIIEFLGGQLHLVKDEAHGDALQGSLPLCDCSA